MDDYGGMVTENPNARFKITDAPTLPPGEDFITRSASGPFIDTGCDVAWGAKGRVYLTVETVREMADIAGLLSSKASEKVRYDEAYRQGYADALKEKLDDNLRKSLNELLDILRGSEPEPAPAVPKERAKAKNVSDARDKGGDSDGGEAPAGDGEPDSVDDKLDDKSVESRDETPKPDIAPSGKGNGSGGKQRRANVPSGSGNGANPFRL